MMSHELCSFSVISFLVSTLLPTNTFIPRDGGCCGDLTGAGGRRKYDVSTALFIHFVVSSCVFKQRSAAEGAASSAGKSTHYCLRTALEDVKV